MPSLDSVSGGGGGGGGPGGPLLGGRAGLCEHAWLSWAIINTAVPTLTPAPTRAVRDTTPNVVYIFIKYIVYILTWYDVYMRLLYIVEITCDR